MAVVKAAAPVSSRDVVFRDVGRGGPVRESRDVVVIGAGIVGCAVAYYMAKAGLTVTLLDKGSVGGGVTGASLAAVGTHMISLDELPYVIRSVQLWDGLQEELDRGFEYSRCGKLRIIFDEAELASARRWVEEERAAGLRAEVLSEEEARRLLPVLEGSFYGATFAPDHGVVNPFLSCRALTEAAVELGATVYTHTPVTGVAVERGRVVGVQTEEFSIAADWVVNAAGPWAADVARMAGVDVPIAARKAQCLATERMPPVVPFIVATAQAQGGGVQMGYSQIQQAKSGQVLFNTVVQTEVSRDEAGELTNPVDAHFIQQSVVTLLHLFPSFNSVQLLRSWARYEAVTPDSRFIVGDVPELEGFLMAAGDAGTGFIRAPLFGQLLAERVTSGRPSMSLDDYAASRFGQDGP